MSAQFIAGCKAGGCSMDSNNLPMIRAVDPIGMGRAVTLVLSPRGGKYWRDMVSARTLMHERARPCFAVINRNWEGAMIWRMTVSNCVVLAGDRGRADWCAVY